MLFSTLLPLVPLLQSTALAASYAPSFGTCPDSNTEAPRGSASVGLVRDNDYISNSEYDWVRARQNKTTETLFGFLNSLNLTDFGELDFTDYFDGLFQSGINIGLAFSGGGFRAMLTGAGEIAAMDSRSSGNGLQGLLDSSTYISGLSGGSLLLSSLIFQNWSSVEDILDKNEIWNLTEFPVRSDIGFWTELIGEISPKDAAGFEVSLVDVFGRILSKIIYSNVPDYGIDLTWSSIQTLDAFSSQDMPFPIILATGVYNNLSDIADTLFEITPYEFGSWNRDVGGFLDMELFGTQLTNGEPLNSTSCVFGFDNAGFLVGTSSNILAAYADYSENLEGLTTDFGLNVSSTYLDIFANMFSIDRDDLLFSLAPNPFYDNSMADDDSNFIANDTLRMVDTGLFSEDLPLDPLMAASRELDIIFAFDNSADTEDNFPDGTSLYATMERLGELDSEANFYKLPSTVEEFVEEGLNQRPVFFGCNGSTLITDDEEYTYMKPLLVYYPNQAISFESNVTGFVFSMDDREAMIQNGFEIATRNSFADDEEFAQCIGCAILRRSQERIGNDIGDQCQSCFDRYCYASDDEVDFDEDVPTDLYDDSPSSTTSTSSSKAGAAGLQSSSTGALFTFFTSLICMLV